MNYTNSPVNNYLFTSSGNEDNIIDFVKIAVGMVQVKKTVLLFTRKHVDFMPVLAGLNREQMQNIKISYHSDINGIIGKLLELHDWMILPDFVILNLNSYFDDANEAPPFKKVCFCIATLFSYMRSLEKQRGASPSDIAHYSVKSVTLLNAHQDVQMQLLIDFYFYKMATFHELDAIKNEVLV